LAVTLLPPALVQSSSHRGSVCTRSHERSHGRETVACIAQRGSASNQAKELDSDRSKDRRLRSRTVRIHPVVNTILVWGRWIIASKFVIERESLERPLDTAWRFRTVLPDWRLRLMASERLPCDFAYFELICRVRCQKPRGGVRPLPTFSFRFRRWWTVGRHWVSRYREPEDDDNDGSARSPRWN